MKNNLAKIKIDDIGLSEKPEKGSYLIGQLVNRLKASQNIELPIEDFAEKCLAGYTYVPSWHQPGKKDNDSWLGQNIFALDFDDNTPVEAIIQICEDYDIIPAFIYSSFSDTPEYRKFRVVFKLDCYITDDVVRKILVESFKTIFGDIVDNCFDKPRFFYGAKQNTDLLYENFESEISLSDLVFGTNDYILNTFHDDINQRELKVYYQKCSFVKRNKSLKHDILPFDDIDDNIKENIENKGYFLTPSPPKNNDGVKEERSIYNIYFISTSLLFNTSLDNRGRAVICLYIEPQIFINKKKVKFFKEPGISRKITEIKNLNINNCKLLDVALNTNAQLHHNEIFHLLLNLQNLKGGKKLFTQILDNRLPNESVKWNNGWLRQWQSSVDNYIGNSKCETYSDVLENSCNCYNDCPFKEGSIISILKKDIAGVQIVDRNKEIEYDKNVDDIYQEMSRQYEQALKSDDTDIHIFPVATGAGKTKLMIDTIDPTGNNNTSYAFPTHVLKNEFFDRAVHDSNIPSSILSKTPDLKYYLDGNSTEYKKINRLYQIGAFSKVFKYLLELKENGDLEIAKYIQVLQKNLNFKGNVLTTHSKMIMSEKLGSKQDLIVFDEDPIDILIPEKKVDLKDLLKFKDKIEASLFRNPNAACKKDYELILELLESVEKTPHGLENKNKNRKIYEKAILEELAVESDINTNILEFMQCDNFIKGQKFNNEGEPICDEYIAYRRKNNLPNKKIIIFSATVNPDIYKSIYPDRNIHVYKYDGIKSKGQVIQYTNKGFSKKILKSPEGLAYAEELINEIDPDKKMPIITLKFIEDYFKNQGRETLHFGAVSGIDIFKGKDIIVLGTPHLDEASYVLLGGIIGENVSILQDALYQNAEYRNRKFKFWTFGNNPQMQALQLWMIEREMLQAIGRARHLREDCTVYVLSNLPIVGAEYRKFFKKKTTQPEKEKNEIIEDVQPEEEIIIDDFIEDPEKPLEKLPEEQTEELPEELPEEPQEKPLEELLKELAEEYSGKPLEEQVTIDEQPEVHSRKTSKRTFKKTSREIPRGTNRRSSR